MSVSWSDVQALHGDDLSGHWLRSRALGMDCPLDVFEQLFFDHHNDRDFAAVVASVDWASVAWQESEWSAEALRRVGIPRPYQHAVDEARRTTFEHGLQDERAPVIEQWRAAGSWLRSPILVAGALLGSSLDVECLVGFTRLGNLLALLDREEVPASSRHRAWLAAA